MKQWIGSVKSLLFHLKWTFMSSQRRYAYLWARTKKLGDLGYTGHNAAVSPNK
jgi:hypothetical protein